jgi:BirA family biotin operon repressor/biotin-[acetyl-CoA-carboxylase] ligase
MSDVSAVLNRTLIVQGLGCAGVEGVRVDVFEELASTNLYLVEQLSDHLVSQPWVVLAERQSRGVGRRGKQWISSEGNINLSLLRFFSLPVAKLMGLSLVTGLTVACVLNRRLSLSCKLKWPNDIILNDAKLGGILTEIPKSDVAGCTVITGIGLNVEAGVSSTDVGQEVACLASHVQGTIDRNALVAEITVQLLENYRLFEASGLSGFTRTWNQLDYLTGKPVRVFQGKDEIDGIAQGINAQGELLVKIDGQVRSFNSGDVSVRRV